MKTTLETNTSAMCMNAKRMTHRLNDLFMIEHRTLYKKQEKHEIDYSSEIGNGSGRLVLYAFKPTDSMKYLYEELNT